MRTSNGIEAASPGGGSARRGELFMRIGLFLNRQHHVDHILGSTVISGLFDSVAAPQVKTRPRAASGPASSPAWVKFRDGRVIARARFTSSRQY